MFKFVFIQSLLVLDCLSTELSHTLDVDSRCMLQNSFEVSLRNFLALEYQSTRLLCLTLIVYCFLKFLDAFHDLLEALVECLDYHSVLSLDCCYLFNQVVDERVVQSQSVLAESVLSSCHEFVVVYRADLNHHNRLR